MYNLVALAGTFDRLHKGHEHFISEAFKHGENVLIGLTSDQFTKSKIKNQKSKMQTKTQTYKERKKHLEEFLNQEGLLKPAKIVKIENVYGPAITNMSIEALVVTEETRNGGEEVNRKRKELNMNTLPLVVVTMIQAENKDRISSTRIRNGEIDRGGRLYRSKIKDQRSKISERLRLELKKPLGELIPGDPLDLEKIIPQVKEAIQKLSGQGLLITVGDEVTKLCNEMEFVPDLAIFDLHVNRLKKYEKSTHTMFHNVNDVKMEEVVNPSGTIQSNLVNKVSAAIQDRIKTGKKQLIHVIGEDDLAGVPVVLLAPLGSVVLYGQPGKGMVVVDVTEEKKDELARMMEKYR